LKNRKVMVEAEKLPGMLVADEADLGQCYPVDNPDGCDLGERHVGLKVKRDQILATGAKLIIAPCLKCRDAIGIWRRFASWGLGGAS
jgi:hypothetical protein